MTCFLGFQTKKQVAVFLVIHQYAKANVNLKAGSLYMCVCVCERAFSLSREFTFLANFVPSIFFSSTILMFFYEPSNTKKH